jgi:hypothetical protein
MSFYASIIVMLATVIFFAYKIRTKNNGVIPFFELGLFYALIVFLYFAFPVALYVLNGNQFLIISDHRLVNAWPTPGEMAEVSWYYVCYMLAYTGAYISKRKAVPCVDIDRNNKHISKDPYLLIATVTTYIFIFIFLTVIEYLYQLNAVTNYGETYLVVWQLPTFIRQIYNHAGVIKITTQIVLIILIFSSIKKYKYHIMVLWIGFEITNVIITQHGRSALIFFMFTALLAHHYLVKPLKIWILILASMSVLLAFNALGQMRGSGEVFASVLSIFAKNEFEAVFATVFDYLQIIKAGSNFDIPLYNAWFADLLNIIPQQIAPFEKIDLNHFYSLTHMVEVAEQGGGFPGGTLLEAMMGLGIFDTIWKGTVVGYVFGYIHNKCILTNKTMMKTIIYIWIIVLSYKTFSRGTFMLVPSFMFDFIVPIAFIKIISYLIKGVTKPIASNNPKVIALG